MRRLRIDESQIQNSPLRDLEQKVSPLRSSIHEMITEQVSYSRIDVDALLGQIESMQQQIEQLTLKA